MQHKVLLKFAIHLNEDEQSPFDLSYVLDNETL